MNLPFYRRIDTCNEGRSRGTSFDKYISLRNPWDVSSKKFVDQWGDGDPNERTNRHGYAYGVRF